MIDDVVKIIPLHKVKSRKFFPPSKEIKIKYLNKINSEIYIYIYIYIYKGINNRINKKLKVIRG